MKKKENNRVLFLILWIVVILYKFAMEWGYVYILSADTVTYPLDFDLFKYINGWIWSIILFGCINHKAHKPSSFMLMMLYILQVIPITCAYAFANESALYYNLLCSAICMVEIICGWLENNKRLKYYKINSCYFLTIFIVVTVIVLIMVYKNNGLPTLTALNIYKVYELRASGVFQLSKYANYIFNWTIRVILPFMLAWSLIKKKYILGIASVCLIFIFYLYTGMKSYLFCIPLVILCACWSKRKDMYLELWICFCCGFVLLVFLACYSPILKDEIGRVYSLFGRRVMMDSAVNKFKYFDFFTNNPKLGMAGIFPRWLVNFDNPYEGEVIGKLISAKYYNNTEMNSNTGFLAEGYMRFGYIGIYFVLIIYGGILRLLDRMKQRSGYSIAVTGFVFPFFVLADGQLLGELFFSYWMIIILVMLFYKEK